MGKSLRHLVFKNKGHWTRRYLPPRESRAAEGPFYSWPGVGWGGDFHLPAVDHDGPSFRRVEELDLADEAQEASGIAGDAVVGPAGEVEEAELPDLMVAFLRREQASVPPAAAPHTLSGTHAEPRLRC